MNALACHVCGVAASGPAIRRYTHTNAGLATPASDYDVSTCPDCLTLDPEEPGVAVRAALRVLGKDEGEWRLAADAFEDAGIDVSRVLYDRCDPMGGRGSRGPQRKPFAHVDKEGKTALRAGYARLLDMRVHAASGHDRPVPPTAPPSGPSGCLLCGVGTSVSWRPVLTSALTRGPQMVDGHLCDTCSEQHDAVGAVGARLVEKACLEAHGLAWSEAMRAPGLTAWVATGLPPGEPWDWMDLNPPKPDLSPLEELQDQVAALRAEVAALRAEVPA